MKNNYLKPKMCAVCGGKCCKVMPGSASPEDFGEPLLERLTDAFKTGKWAVDWWEGDPTGADEVAQGFYVRPRVKDVDAIYDPSWGGECIFLNKDGCELPPDNRPENCRMLEPKDYGKDCILHGAGKREMAIKWMPYHDIIHAAVKAATKEVQE